MEVTLLRRVAFVTFIVFISVLIWYIFFTAYHYFHEYGHYSAGLIEGIPSEAMQLHYEETFGIIPRPTRIDHPNVEVSTFFRFFGGFIAGTIMLIFAITAFMLHRNKRDTLLVFWVIFAITLGHAVFGYLESVIEAFFPAAHLQADEQFLLLFSIFILPISLIFYQSQNRLKHFTNNTPLPS